MARAREPAASLPSAVGVEADLTAPAAVVAATRKTFGEVDVLVLNGGGPRSGTATDLGREDVDAVVLSGRIDTDRVTRIDGATARRTGTTAEQVRCDGGFARAY